MKRANSSPIMERHPVPSALRANFLQAQVRPHSLRVLSVHHSRSASLAAAASAIALAAQAILGLDIIAPHASQAHSKIPLAHCRVWAASAARTQDRQQVLASYAQKIVIRSQTTRILQTAAAMQALRGRQAAFVRRSSLPKFRQQ